ncbi:hypothetical protein [Kibdelosporangium persicum]|uniref:hypothetical protein n=1 Tax=Kibdelosporangium persicum TaxID=2698649 RepID=UPI0028A6356A|nr:hypothetical protein [Kibdelosporangium persicum]
MDNLMHAFAAVLHGASADGCGFGVVAFGVVLVVVGGFGVVVLVLVLVLVVVSGEDVGVVVDGAVVVVSVVVTGTDCWPAARPTGCSVGDEQAPSTAVAATAAPTISLRNRIGSPSAR